MDASSVFDDYDKWFNGVHWRGQHTPTLTQIGRKQQKTHTHNRFKLYSTEMNSTNQALTSFAN